LYSPGVCPVFSLNVLVKYERLSKPVDFQATLLYLMGIDHERLTYKFQGRRFRLTDVEGKVVKDILS
jgi:hypothetical protein